MRRDHLSLTFGAAADRETPFDNFRLHDAEHRDVLDQVAAGARDCNFLGLRVASQSKVRTK